MKGVKMVFAVWRVFAYRFPLGPRFAVVIRSVERAFVSEVFAHRNSLLEPRSVKTTRIVRVASASGVFAHRKMPVRARAVRSAQKRTFV
jgi:hypothetical protein